ncbi:MAG: dihydropteroate synthase [Bacteroidia bacterium]|nr:dihydropteroate synthase [Bacteroidia bacterium]
MDIQKVKIMGIVNLTPDSFYAGSRFMYVEQAIKQIEKHIQEGADIIDVGAQSTRPGATLIDADTELKRLLPVLQELKHLSLPVSIDTFYAKVAQKCLSIREVWINDISGGNIDKNMLSFIFSEQPTYIWTHSRGTPATMNTLTMYDNVVQEVYNCAKQFIYQAQTQGFTKYIIDVGFGFAKTVAQNFELVRHFERFKELGVPLLVGISRKSMIYKTLQSTPEEALNGTTVLHTLLVQKGADILRVHDVKPAKEVIQLLSQI